MAKRLAIQYVPFAAPGNVEKNYIEKVGGVEATLTKWLEKAKESPTKEPFVEVEGAKETPQGTALTSATFLINVLQVREVHEY